MDHRAFFDDVAKGKIAPCYVFEGTEEYIKRSALAALRKKLLPAGLEDMNEARLTDPDANALIAAAETLPFMADKRLVLVLESGMLSGASIRNGPTITVPSSCLRRTRKKAMWLSPAWQLNTWLSPGSQAILPAFRYVRTQSQNARAFSSAQYAPVSPCCSSWFPSASSRRAGMLRHWDSSSSRLLSASLAINEYSAFTGTSKTNKISKK